MAVLSSEVVDGKFIEDCLNVLEIRHIASSADDGVIANRVKTLNVLETGQGAV